MTVLDIVWLSIIGCWLVTARLWYLIHKFHKVRDWYLTAPLFAAKPPLVQWFESYEARDAVLRMAFWLPPKTSGALTGATRRTHRGH